MSRLPRLYQRKLLQNAAAKLQDTLPPWKLGTEGLQSIAKCCVVPPKTVTPKTDFMTGICFKALNHFI